MDSYVRVCRLDDVPPGAGRAFAVGEGRVAIFQVAGRVFAIDDECPHMGGSLANGLVHRGQVVCPMHGWPFDLTTGRCPEAPEVAVRAYPADVRDGEVYIDPGPQAGAGE